MKSFTVGEAVRQFFSHRRYAGCRTRESVFQVWEEVLGLPEARMALPLSLDDGVLTVGAATSTVASEVSLCQEVYLERLNGYFGTGVIQELRVRVLQGTPPTPTTTRTPPEKSSIGEQRDFDPSAVVLTAVELRWADETAAEVESPDVRAALRRVLLLRLKRAKWEAEDRREP